MYALQSELEQERQLHKITQSKLTQAELLLKQSQQEVAKLEGERRELLARIQALQAIVETLQDYPY